MYRPVRSFGRFWPLAFLGILAVKIAVIFGVVAGGSWLWGYLGASAYPTWLKVGIVAATVIGTLSLFKIVRFAIWRRHGGYAYAGGCGPCGGYASCGTGSDGESNLTPLARL